MHFIAVLENIKIYIKIYVKIAPLCFSLQPSSGSLYMSLASSPSSSSEPRVYAPDAPQPLGLLYDPFKPPYVLDVPTFAARCLQIHATREIQAVKCGTCG